MKYLEDFPRESKERSWGSDVPKSGESKELQSNEIPRLNLGFPTRF
jgi:hypothetical protein